LSDTFNYLDILNLHPQGDKTKSFQALFIPSADFNCQKIPVSQSWIVVAQSAKVPNAMPGFLIKLKNSSADELQDFHLL